MNSCTLNNILFNSEKHAHVANNKLLKDLTIPTGYFVNNVPTLSVPIIYEHCLDCIDEKCIDNCLKLVDFNKHNQSNQKIKNKKTKNKKTNNKKTNNKKTNNTRKATK